MLYMFMIYSIVEFGASHIYAQHPTLLNVGDKFRSQINFYSSMDDSIPVFHSTQTQYKYMRSSSTTTECHISIY